MKKMCGERNVYFPLGRWCAIAMVSLMAVSTAYAGPREQAKRIHDRLVGTPPDDSVPDSVLKKMTDLVMAGNAVEAAKIAMQDSKFYNTTLKNFVTPWTNIPQSVHEPLNDYTATVIGMIRDENDIPFNQVLTGDFIYKGKPSVVPTEYSHTNNTHYIELENNQVDLSTQLERVPQSGLPEPLNANETAGIMTTRAFGEAFLKMGTNRRAIRFVAMNFLCRDLEGLHDVTRPPDRIRKDVDRSPGGDSSIFLNQCIGCHSGMDPLAQAFAHYNFDDALNRIVITPNAIQPKNHINAGNFPLGYLVASNRWDNYWRKGPNAALGWDTSKPGSGDGIKSLGEEIASSRAFSQCQVQKVFRFVCLKDPVTATDQSEVRRITDVFEAGYKMKNVFAEVAAYCKGN